ncbi:leukocyte immunoglobulin-like receptor subfamily A member 6 isoform X2 [Phyllostomus hastatus]|uniref:leukocyte immunoglobulin-like receptor subfamily A member 6 isoform X2 n=1 Tax=Phyllostomus hastatus TaxID=9423 RepID=UPI001E680987|nr:leukocyte immunoglobulin-like receptor subfamily A member 6 isoform X2 [Phyllostomus hastatus]
MGSSSLPDLGLRKASGGRNPKDRRYQLSRVPDQARTFCVGVEDNSHDSLPGLCQGPWDHVQAGVLPKPSIWADPGPRVRHGSPVTIWCQGSLQADGYILYKDRGSQPWETRIPQASSNKTMFLIQSMSTYDTGLYQCAYTTGDTLSERSEALLLRVTGVDNAPSLSAHPGPVVASGRRMSLLCSSQSTWDTFHLLKEGGAEPSQHRESERKYYGRRWWLVAIFPVGPVNTSHGGTYRCYGSNSSNPNVWSQLSVPLHLDITDVYREPSLSAQPCPLVLPGDNLTLQCHSEPGSDRFALTKDEGPTHPQSLHGQDSPDFHLGPVNPSHGGRYRCYSGHNLSYVWSAPSTPLDILIAGSNTQEYTVGNLIRLGVSGLVLMVLGVLLCEAWHSQRRPHNAASS